MTPRQDEPRIVCPSDTSDLLGMQVTIFLVEHKRRKCLVIDRGALEYLALSTCGDKEELVIRAELNSCDRVSEIKVCDDNAFCHVNDKGEAILVDSD